MSLKSKSRLNRAFVASLFVIILSFGNYTRLTVTENIKPIHIVSLLVIGIGIGIFIFTGIIMLRRDDNVNKQSKIIHIYRSFLQFSYD